jgi:hypothetical protein
MELDLDQNQPFKYEVWGTCPCGTSVICFVWHWLFDSHCASGINLPGPALALLREMLDHDDVAAARRQNSSSMLFDMALSRSCYSTVTKVDVRSSQGATSLMFAADAGDEEVCALLLHAGADPSVPCPILERFAMLFLFGFLSFLMPNSCFLVEATDADGDDAVAWAKARGHELSCLGRAS